jgi:cell shape-determining protein MreD
VGVLVFLAWAVLAIAVPDAMPAWGGLDRHAPDLCAALAVYLGTRGHSYGVIGWAALLGALADSASLEPLGSRAFVLAFVAFVFVRRRGGAPVQGAALALAVAAGTWLAHVVGALRALPLHREVALGAALVDGFPIALWTMLLAHPLLGLLDRSHALDDILGRRRGRPA